jgi:hypothetical protein
MWLSVWQSWRFFSSSGQFPGFMAIKKLRIVLSQRQAFLPKIQALKGGAAQCNHEKFSVQDQFIPAMGP